MPNTPNPSNISLGVAYLTGNFREILERNRTGIFVLRHFAKYNYKYQNCSKSFTLHLAARHTKKKLPTVYFSDTQIQYHKKHNKSNKVKKNGPGKTGNAHILN